MVELTVKTSFAGQGNVSYRINPLESPKNKPAATVLKLTNMYFTVKTLMLEIAQRLLWVLFERR